MNTVDLLKHQIDKFGVVTVMDVLLVEPGTENPLLFLDTLKITSINQEGQQKEIRGGIGAPELIIYDFARSVSVEIQDALASMSSLGTLWGGKMLEDFDYTATFNALVEKKGEKFIVKLPEEIKAANLKDFDKSLVIDSEGQLVYHVEGVAEGDEALELAAPVGVTIVAGSYVKVFVPASAKATVKGGAAALAINSLDLPPTVKLIGSTYFIDQATGKKVNVEIEIPLLKINISGGLTMEAEGDAAVFDFNGKALADPITKNFFILKQLGK